MAFMLKQNQKFSISRTLNLTERNGIDGGTASANLINFSVSVACDTTQEHRKIFGSNKQGAMKPNNC